MFLPSVLCKSMWLHITLGNMSPMVEMCVPWNWVTSFFSKVAPFIAERVVGKFKGRYTLSLWSMLPPCQRCIWLANCMLFLLWFNF